MRATGGQNASAAGSRAPGLRDLVGPAAYVELAGADEAGLEAVIGELQDGDGPTVVDLRVLPAAPMHLFEDLQRVWTADVTLHDWVPKRDRARRVAIVLSYEAWALLPCRAKELLKQLAVGGVDARAFYAQQFEGGHVRAWFETRLIHHDCAAVISWLRNRWQPANEETWAAVLRQTSKLVQERAAHGTVPHLLLDLAEIAWLYPAATAQDRASQLAYLALYILGERQCGERWRALRGVAQSWRVRGNVSLATHLFERALDTALVLGDPTAVAMSLVDLGGCLVCAGQHALGEYLLRKATELAAPLRPAARVALSRALARALHAQGKSLDEAEHHVRLALRLRDRAERKEPREDVELLAQILERQHATRTQATQRLPPTRVAP